MQKMYEESSNKLELYNQGEEEIKLGDDMQWLEKKRTNKNEVK